jgi:hypothetical protein
MPSVSEEQLMKKSVLLAVVAGVTLAASLPTYAASSSSSNESFGTKMKNGVMWGPRKIGAGFKKVGEKMHHNKTPKSTSN